jgi:hypothetical protein
MCARIAATLGWGTAVALVAILATPLAVRAQVDTQTIRFSGMTQTEPAANPCTGVPGTFTETITQGVEHTTSNPDGTYHHSLRITSALTFTPDDPSQPTLTGTTTFGTEQNVTSKTATLTTAFSGRATGSDGSSLSLHGVSHVPVHAEGTVTVAFQVERVNCG